MQGAHRLAILFGEGTHRSGKLVVRVGKHARGYTISVCVVSTDDAEVEVYGMTGGQPGWTETYGWLTEGPWQAEFDDWVLELAVERDREKKRNQAEKERIAKSDKAKKEALLVAAYPSAKDTGFQQTEARVLEAGWYKVTYRETDLSEVAYLPVADCAWLMVIGQERRVESDRVIFNERIMDTKGNLLLAPAPPKKPEGPDFRPTRSI